MFMIPGVKRRRGKKYRFRRGGAAKRRPRCCFFAIRRGRFRPLSAQYLAAAAHFRHLYLDFSLRIML
jgi:hypothetical protein